MISTVKPYEGSGSGLTEYAYQLTAHMKPLLLKRDSLELLYALDQAKRTNIAGLIKSNTSFKRKVAMIPKDGYDIIHILDHEVGFAAKILKKTGNNARVITTIHDLSRLEKGLHRGVAQKVYNKLVKGSIADAVKYSDFILCNSSQTYATLQERFGRHENVKTVLHGTGDRMISAPIPKNKRIGAFTVGYIGALVKHKNVAFMLETAKLLKDKNYRFIIYGTGADMKLLLKFKDACA